MFDDTGRYPSTNLECSITTFDYRVAPPQVCIPEWLPSRCQNVAAGDPALRLGFASLFFCPGDHRRAIEHTHPVDWLGLYYIYTSG